MDLKFNKENYQKMNIPKFKKDTLTKELVEHFKTFKSNTTELESKIKKQVDTNIVLQNELQIFKDKLKEKEEDKQRLIEKMNEYINIINELGEIITNYQK